MNKNGKFWCSLKRIQDVYNTGNQKQKNLSLGKIHEERVIAERILEKGTVPVDTYTGATGSSNMFIEAVKDAMIKAGFKF